MSQPEPPTDSTEAAATFTAPTSSPAPVHVLRPGAVVDGPPGPDGPTKMFMLPSGRTVVALRVLRGRHQRDAMRAVGKDMASLPFALVAVACKIDGQALPYEALLDLPLGDTNMLLGEVLGKEGT